MNICWARFNIYLALALALTAVCGCKTTEETDPTKMYSTFRMHLEVSRDGTKANQPVPIHREKPVMVNAELQPFLTEGNVAQAQVIDVVGGFALRIRFDEQGRGLFEQYTTENRGRRMAIFCQFGDKLRDARWLAAPIIVRRISDGILTFTPDASREECDEIACGLNNTAKKVQVWPGF